MSSQSPKRFTLKAPSAGMYGGAITCETTRSVLRISPDGLLTNLTEEQALEFLSSGWTAIEGRAVLELRKVSDVYARAAAAFATAEDAASAAIRAARADGVSEDVIGEILNEAGKAQQTVLPDAADIAGPAPEAPKVPAPTIEPPAPKGEAPAEKKPAGGKKSLSATALEAQAAKAAEAPAVEPPAAPAPVDAPAEPPKE